MLWQVGHKKETGRGPTSFAPKNHFGRRPSNVELVTKLVIEDFRNAYYECSPFQGVASPWLFFRSVPEIYLQAVLRELLLLQPPHLNRILLPRLRLRIMRIQIRQRQIQKLMLIPPPDLTLGELLGVCGTGRWVGDLRYQIRRGRFGDAVDQDTEQRDLEEDVEADAEAEEEAFAVVEPEALLRGREADA